MRILLIAPFFDRNVPGESWSTYKWVQGISQRCETVVLTQHYQEWRPEESPVGDAKVINWRDPRIPGVSGRLLWELAPTYPVFYARARKWIKEAQISGIHYDLVHQINPLALRYPCPARGFRYKYAIGPLAGSLPTPPEFSTENTDRHWFRKLRHLDRSRFRWDPWLRKSYSQAALLLGVAPYVREVLSDIQIRRFECMSETGVENIAGIPKTPPAPGEPFRLLFVGRIIRTKGVVDAIRAVAKAARHVDLRFDIIGDGDQTSLCRQEIAHLGMANCIHLHGRLPRAQIDEWYTKAHVFLFPSFREPSGNVVFEAMSHGLPVVSSTIGGPGHVIDDSCGIRLPPTAPSKYSEAISSAILQLASQPERLVQMSRAALNRVTTLALWDRKVDQLMSLYADIADLQFTQHRGLQPAGTNESG